METARRGSTLEPGAAGHVQTCAECGAYYREQLELTKALRALPDMEAPSWMGARVSTAIDGKARRTIGFGWRVGAAAAMAAMAAVGIAIIPRPRVKAPAASADPFIAIPYVAPLAPYELAEVRHMDIPVAALIAAGLDVGARRAGTSVPADVLFGQDGRVHAIRLDHN